MEPLTIYIDELTKAQKTELRAQLKSTQFVQLVFDPEIWPNPLDGLTELMKTIPEALQLDALYCTRQQVERAK